MSIRSCLLLSLVLACCLPAGAQACSCVRTGTLEEERAGSARVFLGRVVAVEDQGHPVPVLWLLQRWDGLVRRLGGDPPSRPGWGYRVAFEVEETFKGRAMSTVEVDTGYGGGDCGYPFEVGRRYVVFAQGADEALGTGICSSTAPLERFEGLEALRAVGRRLAP